MKEIQLTGGYKTVVDDDDYEKFSKYRWYYQKIGKVVYARGQDKDKKFFYLHRSIMRNPKGVNVDHINRNGLDNRKSNLRIATKSQNGCNRGPDSDNTTGYKGVIFHKGKWRKKRFIAQITKDKKIHRIGYFLTAKEAAIAWNKAAIKYHGEFAYQNNVKL